VGLHALTHEGSQQLAQCGQHLRVNGGIAVLSAKPLFMQLRFDQSQVVAQGNSFLWMEKLRFLKGK
jgi:hypothetical protein